MQQKFPWGSSLLFRFKSAPLVRRDQRSALLELSKSGRVGTLCPRPKKVGVVRPKGAGVGRKQRRSRCFLSYHETGCKTRKGVDFAAAGFGRCKLWGEGAPLAGRKRGGRRAVPPLFPAASRLARFGGDVAFLSVGARAAGGKGAKQSKGQISAPFSPPCRFLDKGAFSGARRRARGVSGHRLAQNTYPRYFSSFLPL